MRCLNAGLGVVLIAAVLAGCGSENAAQTGQSTPDTSKVPPAPSSPAKPPRQAFDPPKVFEKTTAKFPVQTFAANDRQKATLYDGNIYTVGKEGLNAFDGLTAEPLWTVPAKVPIATLGFSRPPVVHQDKLYAAISGLEAAQGTKPARPVIEVLAVDVRTGKPDWSTTIDVETKDPGNTVDGDVSVVGVSDTSVVVTYHSKSFILGNTYVLSTDTHQVRWNKDKFLAGDVDSGVVVGNTGKPFVSEPRALAGFAETDGSQKWSVNADMNATEITPLAPKVVGANLKFYSNGDQRFDILDVTTGKALYTLPIDNKWNLSTSIRCFYDQTSIIVCDGKGERTFAFDADNVGQTPIWEITKTTDRVPPTITAAYHGLIYGSASGTAVALDAKTGKDVPDAPGVAPEMVDKYLAVDNSTTYKPTK